MINLKNKNKIFYILLALVPLSFLLASLIFELIFLENKKEPSYILPSQILGANPSRLELSFPREREHISRLNFAIEKDRLLSPMGERILVSKSQEEKISWAFSKATTIELKKLEHSSILGGKRLCSLGIVGENGARLYLDAYQKNGKVLFKNKSGEIFSPKEDILPLSLDEPSFFESVFPCGYEIAELKGIFEDRPSLSIKRGEYIFELSYGDKVFPIHEKELFIFLKKALSSPKFLCFLDVGELLSSSYKEALSKKPYGAMDIILTKDGEAIRRDIKIKKLDLENEKEGIFLFIGRESVFFLERDKNEPYPISISEAREHRFSLEPISNIKLEALKLKSRGEEISFSFNNEEAFLGSKRIRCQELFETFDLLSQIPIEKEEKEISPQNLRLVLKLTIKPKDRDSYFISFYSYLDEERAKDGEIIYFGEETGFFSREKLGAKLREIYFNEEKEQSS